MVYYKDLRDYINALEDKGKLCRVKRLVNKDTELMPVVRWQYCGLPQELRKAFLFEKTVDAKGRRYDTPIGVALIGASREVYAIGMKCRVEELLENWNHALLHPIEPRIVGNGPVKEEIHAGTTLEEHGGLEEFPIPISTPGYDPAPYITAPFCVTKDPENKSRNVGTYRIMVKEKIKTGFNVQSPSQHGAIHWKKCKDKGRSMELAVVMGAAPSVGMVSVAKIPYGVDEFSVAGGIAKEPLELVKCETVDLEVPATSEIMLEGEVTTNYFEPEGPFGEWAGYVGTRRMNPCFNIKCITHRKNPVYQAFISQMPPTESSLIRGISHEAEIYGALKYHCNVPGVLDVALHESGSSWFYCVIKLRKLYPHQPWQALHAAVSIEPYIGKITIAVDDDIDARDPNSVNWALSFRMQPDSDIEVVKGKVALYSDPSSISPHEEEPKRPEHRPLRSAVLIDATRKWDYPPVSLPKREYMERARKIWEEEGMPKLTPREPWFGYTLGYWTEENVEEAELAVKGEHGRTAKKLTGRATRDR